MFAEGHSVRTNLIPTIRQAPKSRGFVSFFVSVLIGLVLARFTLVSTGAAVVVLAAGIVLALSLFFRKLHVLIYGWFVLSGLVFLIPGRLLPQYFQSLGTAIFWGLLFCIMAAWALDNCLEGMKFVPFANLPIKFTMLLFLLWGIISVYTAVNMHISIRRFSHIAIGLGASYMFYDFFSRDDKNIRRTIAIIFFMTLLVSTATAVTGVYCLLSGLPIYKQMKLWFMGSNAVGSLLCNSIPILLTAGVALISRKSLKTLFIAVMLLALFLSFSRTSWMGTLAAIGFLLWKSRIRQSIWVTVIVGLVVVAWLFPVVGGDVHHYITGERYSGRQKIWEASWKMACDYPFFGVGPGNAMFLMPEYLADPAYASLVGVEDTHSLYLKNAAEMGFASAVIWLAIFAVFVYYSTKIERSLNCEFLKLAARGSTATFIGLSIHGISENGFFMTPFVAAEYYAMLPYIVFAIPFAAKKLEEKGNVG